MIILCINPIDTHIEKKYVKIYLWDKKFIYKEILLYGSKPYIPQINLQVFFSAYVLSIRPTQRV